jgi:hypothetical protein
VILYKSVGFKVLRAAVMKSSVFWDIMLCTLVMVNYLMLGLLFNLEDGGSTFLLDTVSLSLDYMALYLRR